MTSFLSTFFANYAPQVRHSWRGKHPFLTCLVLLGYGIGVALLWLMLAGSAMASPSATTRYVATNGVDAGTCNSMVAPCRTLQYAINAAAASDNIYMAGGVYSTTGSLGIIPQAVKIFGAYNSSFTSRDTQSHPTILDANWGGSVISITYAVGVGLDMLTLQHGNGAGNCYPRGCGGGVASIGTNLYVSSCVISDNIATQSGEGWGGGLYTYGGDIKVVDTQITNNTASNNGAGLGGGAYFDNSTLVHLEDVRVNNNLATLYGDGSAGGVCLQGSGEVEITHNTIISNIASWDGGYGNAGGMYLGWTSATIVRDNYIEDNHVTNNPASWGGYAGAVYIRESDAHLSENRIRGNSAGGEMTSQLGSAIYINSTKPVTLSNNLIVHNGYGFGSVSLKSSSSSFFSHALLFNNTIADNHGTGVSAWNYSVLTMTNNLIANHDYGVEFMYPGEGSYVAVDHNLFWNTSEEVTGTSAILADPMLSASYHLLYGSPALDAGVEIRWLTHDLDGVPRPQNLIYDIGAFEGPYWQLSLPLLRLD
jgi:hypothetical protein